MAKRSKAAVEEVKEMLEGTEDRLDLDVIKVVDPNKFVPTGSTLLNLAMSDNPDGGFYLGTIANIIGDSAAGKTFLAWTVFSEIVYNSRFDKHKLIYDEPESSLAFNIVKLFGESVAERVTITASESVEDWHDNVMDLTKNKDAFIECLDSLDAICTEDEIDRDVHKGTFGGQKPKLVGEVLRKIVQRVKNTNSLILVISQTRDNIGVSFGEKRTRSGGKALKFFSSHEMWLAVKEHIKRRDRDVGVVVKLKISKNKLTGKLRTIEFPIYYDYGIDDIVSCINFLVSEGRWTETKKIINTNEDFINGKADTLVDYIEKNNLQDKLKQITTDVWREIEESIATKRVPKYSNK